MTELLVATKKGLFAFDGAPGEQLAPLTRSFAGDPVDYAMRDPRSGRILASVTSPFYGPKIWYAEDPAGEWAQATGVAMPEGEDTALARIWTLVAGEADGVVYAGGDPGVLFESRDGGISWALNQALWEHPTRPCWEPGGGGLCIHAIAPWPGNPDRLALGISAAGIWLTDDGGATWRQGNEGIVPRYLPEEARDQATSLCIHAISRAPARPERLFMQFHGGVYRSDDSGETWTDIADGLPADFAFPITVDPADPDSAYVIPLTADLDRVTSDGRVRVYETRDAGASWTARGDGLPQQHAYLTVLRHAFAAVGEGPELELYFGTTS
ncbi:MAG: exo-alpha-sialidase, partial [Actinomycetota bacterium]|nr:exo-alpha-sialidase [Actinomycetota bacterium]